MHNTQTHADISQADPARTTAVRIYSYQQEFNRGVRSMQRDGWLLRTFHETRSPQAMDLIHASIPGMIPSEARPQIVAHFVCLESPSVVTGTYRRRLSRALIMLAERIDCTATSRNPEHSCMNLT